MKKVLFVILERYADWEAAYVSAFLQCMGQGAYAVKTVSITKEPIKSAGGFTVIPDYDIQNVPEDYEALILIGGFSWRTEEAKKIIPLVQKAYEAKKILGGICDGSGFLGVSGVLNQVKHTSNELNDLKGWAGASYTGEKNYMLQSAVRDDNIITANGTAPLEFAKEVMMALAIAPESTIDGWYNFYKRGMYEAAMPTM